MIVTSFVNGESSEKASLPFHNDSSESESDISLDSELSRTSGGSNRPVDAIQSYCNEIIDIIDKLFNVSILIRRGSRNFRTSRAAAHIEKDEEGHDVVPEFKSIVSLRIAGLCPETPPWLVQRLTNVIAMRRQQFYYQRAHKKRLANIPTIFEDKPQFREGISRPNITYGAKTTRQGPSMARHHQLSAPKTVKTGSSSKTYGTMATELILEEEQTIRPILAKPAPSEKRLGENIFPAPPKEPRGKPFECNQCFYILPDETRQLALWRFVCYFILQLTLMPENISNRICNLTRVFQNSATITINYSRLGKNGSRMNSNSTMMNGGVTLLTTMIPLLYFNQKKNSKTTSSWIMPTNSLSFNYLSWSIEGNVLPYFRSRHVRFAIPLG